MTVFMTALQSTSSLSPKSSDWGSPWDIPRCQESAQT
jgi:hypothetical protein